MSTRSEIRLCRSQNQTLRPPPDQAQRLPIVTTVVRTHVK